MERGPLIEVLTEMIGTDKELSIIFYGESAPMEIRNVQKVLKLTSSQGLLITTKSNKIWLDAAHVSAAWQARDDF